MLTSLKNNLFKLYLSFKLKAKVLEYINLEDKDPSIYVKIFDKNSGIWFLEINKKTLSSSPMAHYEFVRIRTINKIWNTRENPYFNYDYIVNIRNWWFIPRTNHLSY